MLSLFENGFTEYSALALSLREMLADDPANGIGALPMPSGPSEADPLSDRVGLDLMPDSVV